jgi:hypothetical protein
MSNASWSAKSARNCLSEPAANWAWTSALFLTSSLVRPTPSSTQLFNSPATPRRGELGMGITNSFRAFAIQICDSRCNDARAADA